MEEKDTKVEKPKKEKAAGVIKYNILQACLLLKINGRNFNVAVKKFKGEMNTESGWKALFKKHKIIGK